MGFNQTLSKRKEVCMQVARRITVFVVCMLAVAYIENSMLVMILPENIGALAASLAPQLVLAQSGVIALIPIFALTLKSESAFIVGGSVIGLGIGAYCATVTPELNGNLANLTLAGLAFTSMAYFYWQSKTRQN